MIGLVCRGKRVDKACKLCRGEKSLSRGQKKRKEQSDTKIRKKKENGLDRMASRREAKPKSVLRGG